MYGCVYLHIYSMQFLKQLLLTVIMQVLWNTPKRLRLWTISTVSSISDLKFLGKEYEGIATNLTHSLIPIASCTDLGVGDVEVPSVHLFTPLITDYRQIDHLQYVIMASPWKSLRLHIKVYVLWQQTQYKFHSYTAELSQRNIKVNI